MSKELPDFEFRHFSWVSFVVKENEVSNPTNIGLLCPIAVMLEARNDSDLFQQIWSRHCVSNVLYFKSQQVVADGKGAAA